MAMVDVGNKLVVRRFAEAKGKIFLKRETIEMVRNGKIEKGDPLICAEIAGINAAKQTHLLIPYCHQILLDHIKIDFSIDDDGIETSCDVLAFAKTGVEMEAIVGVTMALNTIWDMVKYLEKDQQGQYPYTQIGDIRVIKKEKKEV